jgi:hypothetical protein
LATIAVEAYRAEAERDRAALERLQAVQRACSEIASRGLEACASK